MSSQQLNNNISKENFVDVSARCLIFLLRKLGIYELFEKHPKEERYKRCIYSMTSLLMIALQMLLFRCPSKNDFYQKKKLGKSYKNIGELSHIKEDRFPHSKTIDDAFLSLDPLSLEPILFAIFKKLMTCKLFRNHPSLKKRNIFRLAIDATVTHVYYPNSQHPCQACPFCLKRQREDGKVWFLHIEVVASFIFEGGLQIPLYCYSIRKRRQWERLSESKLKEECEQTALPMVLEKIRACLPKLKITVLLDGLHANQTSISLLKKFYFDFDIVLKRLKSVQEEIDPLNSKVRSVVNKRFNGVQTATFTNDIPYRDIALNALEFHEHLEKKKSRRFAKITSKDIYYQWIVSEKVDETNVFEKAEESRSRWKEEDLFNSLKKRGFNLKHDWSRHPMVQKIWLYLTLLAFALTSILQLCDLGVLSRKGATLQAWMKQMLQDLLYLSYECIFLCAYPKQLRFSLWMNAG